MLEPQSRAALTEQLKPPTGFELGYAVGTSFTLNLETALSIPLSFASHRISAADGDLGVLDAVRRAADRVDIFAQAGELSLSSRSDLVAFLEPMVHPVRTQRGLFHPKVWFLEYVAGDAREYRFICASRNLSADRSWDVVIRLDGRLDDNADPAVNAPLRKLLRTLPELCVQPMPTERRARVIDFADRWRNIRWEHPPDTRNLAFHVMGLPGSSIPDFGGARSLLISPFLSDDGLALLRRGVYGESTLISRGESIDQLMPASLDPKLATFVLDDAAVLTGGDDATGDSAYVPPGDILAGLHAKVIVVDRRDGSHVFLGSANATGAAWHENVEVMVEVTGTQGTVGVAKTLEALQPLPAPYPSAGGAAPDPDEAADRRLEGVLRLLAGARLTVRVVPSDPYGVRVWADDSDSQFTKAMARVRADDVTLRWHLLTRPDAVAAELPGDEAATEILDGVELTDITPFIVLVARDRRGRERRTIALAQLLDDIPTRRDAIIAKQLTDPAAFIRFLALLLQLSGSSLRPAPGGGGAFAFSSGAGEGTGLFESLVRAVGSRHEGLADVRRIVNYLAEHHTEQDVLPPGFEPLWDAVWRAHLSLQAAER